MKKDKTHIEILFEKYLDDRHSPEDLDELLRYYELERDPRLLRQLIQSEIRRHANPNDKINKNGRIDRIVDWAEDKLFAKVGRSGSVGFPKLRLCNFTKFLSN